MQTIVLTVFWMICILWAIYYWYLSPNKAANDTPKVVHDCDHSPRLEYMGHQTRRHSTSSIESLEHSDNEYTRSRRKNTQKLKHEIKTRWPSKTSLDKKFYKSF
ncbi:PREDICTED: uncharacterized protein LOC105452048 [Wasmannia auropunctata]|uniref:uncharacterized protein LOC105452048 n=1 Tax=Wasmannia auropunctata TaxID=64793 RepID=UPI0005EDAFCC|nr:PREDICTED: uncharacterized protein LOC105452048 [Wasmannia auropunctata]